MFCEIKNNLFDYITNYNFNWDKLRTWDQFEKEIVSILYNYLTINRLDGNCAITYNEGSTAFPDIVMEVENYGNIGFEVKYKSSNKDWKTLGGSIFETTKHNQIKELYLIFGNKMLNEVKIAEYYQSLSDIKITHSPRYLIDVSNEHSSIFNQLEIGNDNPNELLAKYKELRREQLGEGESLWWLESPNSEKYFDLSLKHFNTLDKKVQEDIIIDLYIMFPEISKPKGDSKKYLRASAYMILNHNTYHHAVRDFFSAGGNQRLSSDSSVIVSAVVKRLEDNFIKILSKLTDLEYLTTEKLAQISENWSLQFSETIELRRDNVVEIWLNYIELILGDIYKTFEDNYLKSII